MERTLSIIKPDAVAKGVIGKILDRFESNGLKIAATRKIQLSRADAEAFYAVHAAEVAAPPPAYRYDPAVGRRYVHGSD